MRMVIVPNELLAAINAQLDCAFEECPDATVDREYFYGQLLTFFDEHGYLPEFTLQRTAK